MAMPTTFPELWMRMVCSGSVDGVLSLYRHDAVLVPTYDRNILQGHPQLRRYFEYFLQKEGLCGQIDGLVTQEEGGLKTISGVYTFRWSEDGVPKGVRARFTYVLVPEGVRTGHIWASDKRWRILTHHSSEMPDV